ncbi:hypothetical protein WHR41_08829 [Cladosporium halotolerans]|uniref:Aquaporin n=1 Tax=Cladosporium halotolerans TaxID=1052096 RepID=A0AB34KED7_9PEZI
MNVQPPVKDQLIVLPNLKRNAVETPGDRKPSLVPAGKPHPVRGHVVAAIGEFLGTFLFLFFAFAGAQVANEASANAGESTPSVGTLLYIALAFGFSLAVNAWVFFRISGGLFNPAVTFGLMLIGCLSYIRAAVVLVAQILGAIASAGVVSALFPNKFAVKTSLAEDTSLARGLFIEMFLTAMLVFTIFLLAAEKHRATFIAPIGIGLALFIAHLAGVRFTGASLNPARSFGPDVVTGSFESHHWIYWVGPLLGSLLAVFAYRVIKALEYEAYGATGQDADHAAPIVPTPTPKETV